MATNKEVYNEFVVAEYTMKMDLTKLQAYMLEKLVDYANLEFSDWFKDRVKEFTNLNVSKKEIEEQMERLAEILVEAWPR